jgi:HlyD family secretion protein
MPDNDATLFRKVALDRLSMPDRVDQTLRLASSKAWLALVAMFVIIGAAAVWAWKGTIATSVSGQGVIVRAGGMITVSAQVTGGQVAAVKVAVGRSRRSASSSRFYRPAESGREDSRD